MQSNQERNLCDHLVNIYSDYKIVQNWNSDKDRTQRWLMIFSNLYFFCFLSFWKAIPIYFQKSFVCFRQITVVFALLSRHAPCHLSLHDKVAWQMISLLLTKTNAFLSCVSFFLGQIVEYILVNAFYPLLVYNLFASSYASFS